MNRRMPLAFTVVAAAATLTLGIAASPAAAMGSEWQKTIHGAQWEGAVSWGDPTRIVATVEVPAGASDATTTLRGYRDKAKVYGDVRQHLAGEKEEIEMYVNDGGADTVEVEMCYRKTCHLTTLTR
ncbi:MAG TPA: hypothetical protein VFY17_01570 [Pilimelia sp.]|nr:hypothetical protein [Pilimelia sp.]